jgi:site-specific DNA-cytosine methylase
MVTERERLDSLAHGYNRAWGRAAHGAAAPVIAKWPTRSGLAVVFFAGNGGDLKAWVDLDVETRFKDIVCIECKPKARRAIRALGIDRVIQYTDVRSTGELDTSNSYKSKRAWPNRAWWLSSTTTRAVLKEHGLDPGRVVVAGGPPCDDYSGNNRYATGIEGPKSQLYIHMVNFFKILCELRDI